MAVRTQQGRPITQGELLATPAEPLPQGPAPPTEPVGYGSLGSLLEEQRARARTTAVSDDQLCQWYEAQVEAVAARVERLATALEHNHALLTGPEDRRWPSYWLLDARYRYMSDTLQLLRQRQHCLFCPNCGLGDIAPDLPPQEAEALSLRGTLPGGEGSMAWTRYCLECAAGPIATQAQALHEAHRGGKK